MCDPITATVIAGTALAVGGTVYSGMATSAAHDYQASVARNNSALAREQARDSEERGARDELRRWQAIAQTKSAQLAGFAANGLDVSFGSPVDVMADTVQVGMQDAWQIRENAGRETRGYLISAANYDSEASAQRAASRNAKVQMTLDAAGTIIGGASKVQDLRLSTSPAAGRSAASTAYGRPSYIGPRP